jgi:uncharacterized sporulation protein YeaH/YhbH (DUF444 family)
MRVALGRRIAMGGEARRQLRQAQARLACLEGQADTSSLDLAQAREEVEALNRRMAHVPFLDPFDLRYRHRVREPVPNSKAVMLCLMDVSGSMDEARKDLAKRFFILLYLFLSKHYQHTEVVFIRHHTQASEVPEQEFFHATESGGTVVSSALNLMHEIIRDRYLGAAWNIYGAQASDGDNWNDDSVVCHKLLMESIMEKVQYFSYIEITPRDHQALWRAYEQIEAAFPDAFAMRQIQTLSDIFPVFRDLFQKKAA